ncbi:hypothetical protein [Paraburkholderia dinghuensis]|uniref:Uncharacterized protein n=1 Tax=Paraburkholderia dinghuensis TaxID=2305225 RepID=A0A3N6MV28_9BURK|nr:hypothetical protein [Paraburkholderia dinghuensis]RQH07824.1 hypothetical protein D1Y85_06855 [Paraburkholderia dinghuensis]
MKKVNLCASRSRAAGPRVGTIAALVALGALTAMTSGCVMDPPGPSPIYSRLPADQSGVPTVAKPLSREERARYDAIDRQALADQDRAMAAQAAEQAWARYYARPVTVYGSYYSGGWGSGWGVGYGAPGWGWGW